MKLVYLREAAGSGTEVDVPASELEILSDPDALLGRLRGPTNEIGWVAIAPEFPDAATLAHAIRAAALGVPVLTAGTGTSVGAEKERLASMASLIAGIAHDVGTPMTAILGYAELIVRSVEDEKNRGRAATIVEQVARVRDLIHTLMEVAGGDSQPRARLDLVDVLERSLASLETDFENARIRVDRDYGYVRVVGGNSGRLERSFRHLLQNSIEAIESEGSIEVRIREERSLRIEVRISDSGSGVDPDVRRRIFEPYFTTHKGSKGLGLLVARTIVREYGGDIRLLASEGAGADFSVTLPILPENTSDPG